MKPQPDLLSRQERNSLSPAEWKALRARDDAQKLVNAPPSLAGFLPDKPPRPRLEAACNGSAKLAPYIANAPLTRPLLTREQLEKLQPGTLVSMGKPEMKTPVPPPSNDEQPEKPEEEAPKRTWTRRQSEPVKPKIYLSSHQRRLAIIDCLHEGAGATAEKWNISTGALLTWVDMARTAARGQVVPAGPEISGVNTYEATQETAKALWAFVRPGEKEHPLEALRGETMPQPLAPTPAPVSEDPLALRATLEGYKIELDKLRMEKAVLEGKVTILQELADTLSKSLAKKNRRG